MLSIWIKVNLRLGFKIVNKEMCVKMQRRLLFYILVCRLGAQRGAFERYQAVGLNTSIKEQFLFN